MLPLRSRPGLLPARLFFPLRSTISRMSSTSTTPMEDTIREKVLVEHKPTSLSLRINS
jgi:hypothetical protein